MLGVIGIIVSLALLIWLAYRGVSVIIIAPILALLAAGIGGIATGEAHLLALYTEKFMVSLGGYVKSYFPMFLLGAIFGKIMDDTGSAQAIAKFISDKTGKGHEMLAVVVSCAVITYGGVSLFVAAFAIYPIGAALYRQAGIPKRFLPGAIALGAFTFTMTAIPGTPQIQNAIPMKFFGTDAYAAPILGAVATIIMFGGGVLWLTRRMKKAMSKGEGYGNHDDLHMVKEDTGNLPSFGVAILPILVVLIGNFIFSKFIFKDMDAAYLEEQFNTTLSAVIGTWSIICALLCGIIIAIIFNFKRFENLLDSLKNGVQGSFLAVMNTASEVGYGNVIAALSAFTIVQSFLTGISSNPLIQEAISSSALAGITGSASGGLSIALETMGADFLAEGTRMGIAPEVLHRVVSVACGGLDTMPQNGAVITLLGVTGLTHKESYGDIAVCTVIIPAIACLAIIILGTMGIA